MGFKINQGSNVKNGAIVWGSKEKTLPLPNIRYFDGSFLLEPQPDYEGQDHPSPGFSIDGHIKEISVRAVPSFNDNVNKTGEKNATAMSILLTSTDGKDYRLVADLYNKDEDYFSRKSLQLLSSLGQLARHIKENPDSRNHIYQIGFFRNTDKNGKFHSNSVIRPPVDYVSSPDNPEEFTPVFDSKNFIRTPEEARAPYGDPIQVGNKTVYDNTKVVQWMEEEIQWVNFAFGKTDADQHQQSEDQSADIAEALESEADGVATDGLAQDLGGQFDSPRG